MSYDNSELLRLYADADAMLGGEAYADAARGIVRWVREVLADEAGGYGASQDADVGLDDDGDYFTWTLDEAGAVLDEAERAVAAAYYDIGTAGEMHHNPGKNVLFVARTVEQAAQIAGVSAERGAELLRSAKAKLLAARQQRPAPFVDRSRYTAWNAMMASAMLRAGAVLDDPWARDHALRTVERIRREALAPDAVAHVAGDTKGGWLEDQVHTAAAAIDAAEATGNEEWATWAAQIMERVWRDYRDDAQGGLFDTAADTSRSGEGLLPMRARTIQDAPTPAPNATAAVVALRHPERTGEQRWRARADEILSLFAGTAGELGLFGATYLLALDRSLHPVSHLVIVAQPGDTQGDAMHRLALAAPHPRRVVRRMVPGSDAAGLPPELVGMLASSNGATGFVCVGDRCLAPARAAAEFIERLA
jgi:uncharacterized protein YyaL (SSP411 family)